MMNNEEYEDLYEEGPVQETEEIFDELDATHDDLTLPIPESMDSIDIIEDIQNNNSKKSNKGFNKLSKRQYIDPIELHHELEKHIMCKRINEDHIMSRKLARMFTKITEELLEKGNFRGYHSGWKDEMQSKAYENLVRYSHNYRIDHVERFDFFLNWIYRVHSFKLQKFFEDNKLNYSEFISNLKDVKRKMFKKSKDPNFVPSATYKKITPDDISPILTSLGLSQDDFKQGLFSQYQDLSQQFEDHKKRNSFNYITMMIYRSAQHVIKVEKKISNDNKRLNEEILYRTDDFDEEAIEKDNRFITFDENKLDYGGFGI